MNIYIYIYNIGYDKGYESGAADGETQGIMELVEVLRKMDTPREVIIEKIMKKFSLTDEKAREFAM